MRKNRWLAALACLALVLIGGFLTWRGVTAAPETQTREAARIRITAEALGQAYLADPEQADRTYLNQVLCVFGTVLSLEGSSLLLGDPECPIQCGFTQQAASQLSEVACGHRVQVKGVCTGMGLFEVGLVRCGLVTGEGSGTPGER